MEKGEFEEIIVHQEKRYLPEWVQTLRILCEGLSVKMDQDLGALRKKLERVKQLLEKVNEEFGSRFSLQCRWLKGRHPEALLVNGGEYGSERRMA